MINVEIRILARQAGGYPLELTVIEPKQEFPKGYLATDLLPWQPGISAAEDGQRLFNYLLADSKIREAWHQLQGQSAGRRLRLRIDEEDPEIHAMPWELLRDGDQVLAASAQTPFSRYLASKLPALEPIKARPLKMVVAVANPQNLTDYEGLTPLDIAQERATLESALANVPAGQLELTYLPQPVTLSALETALRQEHHLLYLAAHGMFSQRRQEAKLFLADNNNQVELVAEREFTGMIQRLTHKPAFIFLAACQSATRSSADAYRGLAPQLVMAGVSAVLAMQDVVEVKTLLEFVRTFYHQLFQHGQIDLASNEARSILLTSKLPGSSIPVLFSRLPQNQLLAMTEGAVTESEHSHNVVNIKGEVKGFIQENKGNIVMNF